MVQACFLYEDLRRLTGPSERPADTALWIEIDGIPSDSFFRWHFASCHFVHKSVIENRFRRAETEPIFQIAWPIRSTSHQIPYIGISCGSMTTFDEMVIARIKHTPDESTRPINNMNPRKTLLNRFRNIIVSKRKLIDCNENVEKKPTARLHELQYPHIFLIAENKRCVDRATQAAENSHYWPASI